MFGKNSIFLEKVWYLPSDNNLEKIDFQKVSFLKYD